MSMIEYNNYQAIISYDPDIEMFMGRVLNSRDVITFYGKSVDELKDGMKISIDDYLALCKEKSIEPEKPYSGKFNLRIDSGLHRLVTIAAAKKGMSLNAFISGALEEKTANMLLAAE